MDVSCENCGAHYELDTTRFKGSSLRVQCSSCGHVFRVQKNQVESLPSPPVSSPSSSPQKWVIRYKDGALSIVPDKATLQRWIVERRVSTEDEVSQDEVQWRKLGDFEEFQPFFLVVAQSTATHLGVSQTGVFAAPILTPGQMTVTPSGNIQNFGTVGITPAAPVPQQLQQAAMAPAPQLNVSPLANNQHLGPSNAFSLDSSPKATLEFGLAQALEELRSTNPALLEAAEAALAQPEHTIASTEGISEESRDDEDNETQERTEISLEGASPQDLEDAVAINSAALDQEEDFVSSPSPPPQTPLPMVAAKPATGEWFMGSSDGLAHTHEPSLQKQEPSYEHLPSPSELDEDLRDFSAYEENGELGTEDLAFRPKRLGAFGRFVLVILVFGLLGGGLYAAQPPWSEPLWIKVGLLEARSSSLDLLKQAQVQQFALTESSWEKASELLKKAETDEGQNFLGLVLARAQQQLTRMESVHLSLQFNQQQQERARRRIKAARRSIASIDPKSPQRAALERSIQAQQQKAAQSLEKLQQEEKTLNRQMEPLARVAQQQLKMAEDIDRHDIRTRILKAHFNALSPGASSVALRFLQSIEKKPLSPEQQSMLQLIRGSLYLRENKREQASSSLDQVCRERPQWVWPILLRGALWSQQKKTTQAANEFKRVLDIAKEHPLATRWQEWLLNPPPPIATAPPPRKRDGKSSSSPNAPREANDPSLDAMPFAALLRAAEKLRGRERFRAAAKYYYAALKKKRSSSVYAGLGWCMLDANRLSKAQSYFKTALKLGPNNALALFGLGLTFRRRGKKQLAKQTLEAYISRFPSSSDAREVQLILKSL